MIQKRGLGMGLNALIPQNENSINEDNAIQLIDITEIVPNNDQPRKYFNDEALNELAASIAEHGILQPLIVRKDDDLYEIITGERRWRAARIAGLKEVPAIVKEIDGLKSIEVALIENLQREDLNSIEEAVTYKRLQEEFNLTQDVIAVKVGKKRSTIANALRLLNLSNQVQEMIINNKISAGHAKALLAVNDHSIQNEIANKIVEADLSVRQSEKIMKAIASEKPKVDDKATPSDSIYYKSVEQSLNTLLGTKVKVFNGKGNRGKIEIEYFSVEDLNRLLELFKKLED